MPAVDLLYVERVLLVCGLPDAGKSHLLRWMLADRRLQGVYPTAAVPKPTPLSNERCLVGRLMSPHEKNHGSETLSEFIAEMERQLLAIRRKGFRRLNYFLPVQPKATANMPDPAGICAAIKRRFDPERLRVVQLDTRQNAASSGLVSSAVEQGLRNLSVEYLTIDARLQTDGEAYVGNRRVLADWFDFS